jgi:hypothetical protein
MVMEAAKVKGCDGSKVNCSLREKRGCTMPRGQELDSLNARIRAKYPKVTAILSEGLCCQCAHRGRYRGCQYGFLPVQADGLHSCAYFRMWGDWRPKKTVESRN